jgi:hypothetical protein
MPGSLAGQLNEIIKPQYGMKQSNNVFDRHLHTLLTSHGHHPSLLAPHIFKKAYPIDPSNYLFATKLMIAPSLGNPVFSPLNYALFLTIADGAYRDFPLTWKAPLTNYCALRYTRTLNGLGPHMRKFLTKKGMGPLPGALTPAQSDFFDLPSNPTPVDPKMNQSTQGGLIFYTPTRSDIKPYVNPLSRRNHHPTHSDRSKQINIMRYIKAYPDEGPTFSISPADYPDGAQLSASAESSHGSLPNGQSLSGTLYIIGHNNAAFASAELGISLSPQEGEYHTLSRATKQCIFWRQFLEGLGFPAPSHHHS